MSLVRRAQPIAGPRPIPAFWRDAAAATGCALITLIVAWYALGFAATGLHTPVVQSADASATSFLFASTVEDGWYAPIERAGAPFGTRLADTPNADGLSLLLNQALAAFTDEPVVRLNVFVLASFLLCALVAHAVYRRLGLSIAWASVATLAFTLLPWHFLADQRPLSALYIAAALAAWLALDVVWRDPDDGDRKPWRGLAILAAVTCGMSGTYQAFFSCLMLATASVAGALHTRQRTPLRRGAILVACVVLATAVQLLPSWANTWRDGGNTAIAAASVGDVEANALKIAPLVLPRRDHGIDALATLRARYEGADPESASRPDVALGLVGACGLLLLLGLPLFPRSAARPREAGQRSATLVYVALLFGTVGALGSLFALFVTPQLHLLDRIAPFIAFIAILTSVGIVQRIFQRRTAIARGIAAVLVAVLIIVDQAGLGSDAARAASQARAGAFTLDRNFHAAVEAALPARSMVWQLPDRPRLQELADVPANALDPFAGYLHTTHLRWSGGATPGRPGARWQRLLDAFPLDARLPVLAALGFSAILLDRRGYSDPAAIDTVLAGDNLQASLHSEDGTRSLYPLAHAKAERYRALAVAPHAGWSEIESDGKDVWLWSTGNASVRLANTGAIARPCYVEFELATLAPRKVTLQEDNRTLAEQDLVPGAPVRLSAYLDERAGERTLDLVTDTPAASPGAQDGRLLAFMWKMRTPPLCR